jgi:glutaminyl-peptide cyclotransferase
MSNLRAYSIEIALVMILAGAVGYFGYLGYGLLTPSIGVEPFSGEQALRYAAKQMEFGERVTGAKGNVDMGDWLVEELRQLGWDVLIQPFSVTEGVTARNIIAVRTSPSARRVGILSTHYDTRLFADRDPDESNHTVPAPGANDGASGVAVLLELARTLDVQATGHTLCLVFLDAEENDGLPGWEVATGSAYFVHRLNSDISRCGSPRFALYLERVGALDQELSLAGNSAPALVSALNRAAIESGSAAWPTNDSVQQNLSPHTRFLAADVPAAMIAGFGYPYQYTSGDTLDKLTAQSLEQVGRGIKSWLEQAAPF